MRSEIVKEEIKKLRKYEAGKRKEDFTRAEKIIKLSSNENNYALPASIKRAIIKCIKDINRYPDPEYRELKKAISAYISLPENNIAACNGSDEALECCFKIFINRGDKVAILFPSFSYYYTLAGIYGAKVKKIELREEENEFRLSLKDFESKAKNAKMVILASPNNPTGNVISREEFEKIMQNLNEKRQVLIMDEAYAEFNELSFAEEVLGYDNLIVTRTFSKAFGLAGLRLGYACANSEIASYIEKVRQPFSISLLSEAGAVEALRNHAHVKAAVEKIKKERERVFKELGKISGIKAYKSKANFILIKMLRKSSEEVFRKLAEKGIIVRECSAFGIENYIRVTVGKRNENNAFLKALKEVIEN